MGVRTACCSGVAAYSDVAIIVETKRAGASEERIFMAWIVTRTAVGGLATEPRKFQYAEFRYVYCLGNYDQDLRDSVTQLAKQAFKLR